MISSPESTYGLLLIEFGVKIINLWFNFFKFVCKLRIFENFKHDNLQTLTVLLHKNLINAQIIIRYLLSMLITVDSSCPDAV